VIGSLFSDITLAQDATLTIEPSHRTIIKNYVVKEHVRPAQISAIIAVGVIVPSDIQLLPVPIEWVKLVPEVRNYEYFDWNGEVVFVEPNSRRVVQIVD